MELHEIDVVIGLDGEVAIRVRGIEGTGCLKTTEALEKLLGTVQSREMSADAYGDPGSLHVDQETRG